MSNVSLIDGHIDEPRMTDEQIIKALECCFDGNCEDCPMCSMEDCYKTHLEKSALDLINRQKAEIDKYTHIKTTINEFWDILLKLSIAKRKEKPTLEEFAEAITQTKSEAIKEFAERFQKEANITCKGKFNFNADYNNTKNNISTEYRITKDKFDEILKEMVGDEE